MGPRLDPLLIPKMSIVQGSESPINIKLEFKDVELSGISSARVYKASGFRKQDNPGENFSVPSSVHTRNTFELS